MKVETVLLETKTIEVLPEPVEHLEQDIATSIDDDVWRWDLVVHVIQGHKKVKRLPHWKVETSAS